MVQRYDFDVCGNSEYVDSGDGAVVFCEDYKKLHDTLTFILTCDQDQLMSEGMDRVRAVLKLADGK